MRTHDEKPLPLISAPYLTENIGFIKSVAECANNLDISHLSQDQKGILTQLATQFKLTNLNKTIGCAADYGQNNHRESSLSHPDGSEEKTLTSFLGGGGKKPVRASDLHRNLSALGPLFFDKNIKQNVCIMSVQKKVTQKPTLHMTFHI